MLGYNVAFAFAITSLAFAAPAHADPSGSRGQSATPASNAASFETKGSGKSWGPSHSQFDSMRHKEFKHGHGYGHGNGNGNGNGHGDGHGNGHGHGHCKDGDRCHASPG